MSADQLFAVTVVFNPVGYKSRTRLYKEFAPYIEYSGIKLFTVEIAFQDRPFEVTTPHNPWNLQLRSTHMLWHKERALNLGFEALLKLVPDAKKVAFLDADTRHTDPNWAQSTLNALDYYHVVQTFSQCLYLGPDHEMLWSTTSRFQCWVDKGYHQIPAKPLSKIATGHPGLSWAFRADTLKKLGGLFDLSVTGSGDTHMANALMGDVIFNSRPGMSPSFEKSMKDWQAKADEFVKGNVGAVKGSCMHYWHGKGDQRGYDKRWDITCFHKYNPYEDIKIGENGLYEFIGNKPNLEYDLRRSFTSRNEDTIENEVWKKTNLGL
jgi:hypothetical protein